MRSAGILASIALCALLVLCVVGRASATDFYELQMYTVDTEPQGHLMVELHSNSVTSAYNINTELPLYQVHNTLEVTYGLLPHVEVGEYMCTARLNNAYKLVGGRTKVHFGLPQTYEWPVRLGMNIELQYMSRQAVTDPFNIEFMPIAQTEIKGFLLVADLTFERQFSGPGTHAGVGFEPAGEVTYRLHGEWNWLEPALEYYGDIGPVKAPVPIAEQQQFIVPSFNLYLTPPLEFNFGVGFGVTRYNSGDFVKGTVGWSF
jgi:hypothetical protein